MSNVESTYNNDTEEETKDYNSHQRKSILSLENRSKSSSHVAASRKKSATRVSYFDNILNDQDSMQRIAMVFLVPLEFYRVVVSSLLIVFVPQNCWGKTCTFQENLESGSLNYRAGLVVNFFTFFIFLMMYACEVQREHLMIEYLDVNPDMKNDRLTVEEALKKLPGDKLEHIKSVETRYRYIGSFAIVMYIVNAVISAVIVFQYNLGTETGTTYATNLLFIAIKFTDVYWTITAGDSIYLSAYLRTKVQFNDADPEYRVSSNSRQHSHDLKA
jgi:hypothetical protein